MPEPQSRSARIAREVFLATLVRGDSKRVAWAMSRVASTMVDVDVREGDTLYREGESSADYFFIVSGAVRLVKPGAEDWTVTGPGLVGVIDGMMQRPRTRTAIAKSDAHLLRMGVQEWMDIIEDSFEMALGIIKSIASGTHVLRLRPPPGGGFEPPPAVAKHAGAARLTMVERILLLHDVPMFARASTQAVTSLAGVTNLIRFAAGDVIVDDAVSRGRLYVVVSGEVEAVHTDPPVTGRFGTASLVCGAAALIGYAGYVARAATDGVLLCLSIEDYFDLAEEHFGLARSAILALSQEREVLLERDPRTTGPFHAVG